MRNRFSKAIYLFEITAIIAFTLSVCGDEVPFWKSKPEVYRRIKEERAIIVSSHVDSEGEIKKLRLVTAGHISAPVDFTHKIITQYDQFSKILPYVVESSFDASTQNLFVHGALLGFHVRMTMKMAEDKSPSPAQHLIRFEVIAGQLIGLKGTIQEVPFNAKKTEISMAAAFEGKNLGIPTVILDWGLEFAGQRAAAKMRTRVEEEWQKSQK